jgi:hypothetical protein
LDDFFSAFKNSPNKLEALSLISICRKGKQLDIAFKVYEILVQKVQPDNQVLGSLISACDKAKEYERLLTIWDDFSRYSLIPNKDAIFKTLHACLKTENTIIAKSILNLLDNVQIKLNVISCNQLIKLFGSKKDMASVTNVLKYGSP